MRTYWQANSYVELCRRVHKRAYELAAVFHYSQDAADHLAESVIAKLMRKYPQKYGTRP